MTVNCAEACINGCILGDQCPHREYATIATQFIHKTSLDKMLEIAEESLRKKLMAPAQWVLPENPQSP
ncbi:hypothetical protein DO97_13060 [Neosynechococcus sphagnicola sy1]|uniref:Uncharacterized protein n=1 Tax=Neosynechococcus sphagnicola sy1 TaxID=1497020 RepID=A0A098TN97_9CYAN|nr:hypothetical protein [Neosynechococcus sphagnicola]KGF73731.1 hypothetical protein DO97_13060 [Neosynechococcus sphagnicola sy1]